MFENYCWTDEEKEIATKMFKEKFNKSIKRAQNITVEETIEPSTKGLKVLSKYKHIRDNFGRNLLGMKLSEAIEMFETFKKKYGDLEIRKQSYINMGLCLTSFRKETDKEKVDRISNKIEREVINKMWEIVDTRRETQRLQERLKKLQEKK